MPCTGRHDPASAAVPPNFRLTTLGRRARGVLVVDGVPVGATVQLRVGRVKGGDRLRKGAPGVEVLEALDGEAVGGGLPGPAADAPQDRRPGGTRVVLLAGEAGREAQAGGGAVAQALGRVANVVAEARVVQQGGGEVVAVALAEPARLGPPRPGPAELADRVGDRV